MFNSDFVSLQGLSPLADNYYLLSVLSRRVILTAKSKGHRDAINEAFDTLDITKTGNLGRHDIHAFLHAAAEHTNLIVDEQDLNSSVVESAVDALLRDAGGGSKVTGGGDGGEDVDDDDDEAFITRQQFHDIFDRHPDMLAVFEDDDISSTRRQSALQSMVEHSDHLEEEDIIENEQIWFHDVITHWKNRWIALVWLGLYLAANVAAFTTKAIRYSNHDEAQAVFGNCITVARGCASALNLNAMLVLLAMCKHVMTLLRKTPLRFIFSFDAIRKFIS